LSERPFEDFGFGESGFLAGFLELLNQWSFEAVIDAHFMVLVGLLAQCRPFHCANHYPYLHALQRKKICVYIQTMIQPPLTRMNDDEKIPVNFRFERTTRATLKALAKATGFTETLILEDALRFLFGKIDADAEDRRKLIQRKAKTLGDTMITSGADNHFQMMLTHDLTCTV
jgi:hypothetical protein